LEKGDIIQPERLPDQITKYSQARIASDLEIPADGINLTAHLDQLEKSYVLEALRRTEGNQTNAADLLQMSVRSLRHLLDKHGIRELTAQMRDRKSTRLNSSHVAISYAVFCLKKKKKKSQNSTTEPYRHR